MPYKDPEVAKIASRERQRKYQETHKEACRERTKKWQQENPEKVRENSRKSYLRRREQLKFETEAERAIRLEKQREATQRYRKRHFVELQDKAERLKGTEKQRAIWRAKSAKWREENPEAAKKIAIRSDYTRYHNLKEQAFELLGSKCSMPHLDGDPFATDYDVLQIDHIEAIGDKERRRLNHRGRKLYQAVIKDPMPFQLLCANHNKKKEVELGENTKWRKRKSDSRNITSALEIGAGTKG